MQAKSRLNINYEYFLLNSSINFLFIKKTKSQTKKLVKKNTRKKNYGVMKNLKYVINQVF